MRVAAADTTAGNVETPAPALLVPAAISMNLRLQQRLAASVNWATAFGQSQAFGPSQASGGRDLRSRGPGGRQRLRRCGRVVPPSAQRGESFLRRRQTPSGAAHRARSARPTASPREAPQRACRWAALRGRRPYGRQRLRRCRNGGSSARFEPAPELSRPRRTYPLPRRRQAPPTVRAAPTRSATKGLRWAALRAVGLTVGSACGAVGGSHHRARSAASLSYGAVRRRPRARPRMPTRSAHVRCQRRAKI